MPSSTGIPGAPTRHGHSGANPRPGAAGELPGVMTDDRLQTYRRKRKPGRSGEPAGPGPGRPRSRSAPVFVIQKHDASTLHYDFRLEIDNVLKSWAVPKGPSLDPRDKRLAVETEDHPLEYAEFEGVIPEAEYGGGTVMIWDRGRYRNLKTDPDDGRETTSMQDAYEQGHIAVHLEGEKLSGGYALTRFRSQGGRRQWLLVKMDDTDADARRNPVSTQQRSVVTGRGLKDIAGEEG